MPLKAALCQSLSEVVPSVETSFAQKLIDLQRTYIALWNSTEALAPEATVSFPPDEQQKNERATDAFIDRMEGELRRYPDSSEEQEIWRARAREALRQFAREAFGFPEAYLAVLFSNEYIDVTRWFSRWARGFDPEIRIDALSQALRNVWVMNSIQMFLDRRPALSPAVFAYSMLYPYTDNYLDEPGETEAAKAAAAERLGRRLAGVRLNPGNSQEEAVFRLVGFIESQYPRGEFPEVYLSVQAIHRAQVRSLFQQSPDRISDRKRILEISVAKGGASVMADAYMVAGNLAEDEAHFFFGYGVMLQLLDDLQDLRRDLDCRHWTIFSSGAGIRYLDPLTSRLHHFVGRVLASSNRFSASRFDTLKDLITRNCTLLLLRSIAHNQEFFSPAYLRHMVCQAPLGFAYLRELGVRIEKRYARVEPLLRKRNQIDCVFDLLG